MFARLLLPESVRFVDTPEETTPGAQALILLTEWHEIVRADRAAIADSMRCPKLVFDGRNALDAALMAHLGFEYAAVGGNSPGKGDNAASLERADPTIPLTLDREKLSRE